MILYLPAFLRHLNGEPLLPAVTLLHILFLIPGIALVELLIRCVFDFAVHGKGTPAPIDPPSTLVLRGPYRFMRNPMYIAVTGLNLLQAALFRSPALAVYTPLLWLGFHLFVVFVEEPGLRKRFDTAYEEYCRKVPRWWGASREE
jgi:protein-S-isoprenylcysteine O-methyltransferase Ste14